MSESPNHNPESTNAKPGGSSAQRDPAPDKRGDAGEVQLTLTAKELAARLGISRAHVWKLLSLGQLPPPVRLGRAVRWDKRVIDAWLTAGAPPMAQWELMKAPDDAR